MFCKNMESIYEKSSCNFNFKSETSNTLENQDKIQESPLDTSNTPKESVTILNPNFSLSPFLSVVEGSDMLTDN